MFSGTVDAAVNGGIKNYETFINGEYITNNPEIAEDVQSNSSKANLVDELVSVLRLQLELLESGIHLHKVKCLDSMKPLHDHIEITFDKMKKELLLVLAQRA